MAVAVTLQALWLNDAVTPSDATQVFPTKLEDEPTIRGETRTYAGGRQRFVAAEGVARKYSIDLAYVTAAQLSWLEGHLGRVVVMRDYTGMRRWVVFYDFKREPTPYGNRHNVSGLTCLEVTSSDVV